MTIGFIHSTHLALPYVEKALIPFAPRARFLHALDDALIVELAKGEGVTEDALRRITFMAESLINAGAERLILSCSSLSPAVDMIAHNLTVPFFKIDESMIASVISAAQPFSIVATNPSTRIPMKIIVESLAERLGIKPDWQYELLDGAFAALNRGDAESHDDAVIRSCERLANEGRSILLAQISMSRIMPRLSETARNVVRTSLDYIEATAFSR